MEDSNSVSTSIYKCNSLKTQLIAVDFAEKYLSVKSTNKIACSAKYSFLNTYSLVNLDMKNHALLALETLDHVS